MTTCVSSLFEATSNILAGATTIELCGQPTIPYAIGVPLDDTLSSFVGGYPLIVAGTQDITIQCGADGSSANGCIFEGGWVQMLVGSANSLTVSGITFTGQMESSSIIGAEPRNVLVVGQVTDGIVFNDCIFGEINTTGHVIDLQPQADTTSGYALTAFTNTVFFNIAHSFDAINAQAGAYLGFSSVAFDNITYSPPELGIGKCLGQTDVSNNCGVASSIIHVGEYFSFLSGLTGFTSLADIYTGVSVSNSQFYTSIIRTIDDWGPKFFNNATFTTLLTSSNNTIYNQASRTANDDYCEGGLAAMYDSATLIDWSCRRTDYSSLSVEEILRCGYDCDMNGEFSTLLSVLAATSLSSTLTGNTNAVTIFAPNNDAFDALPPGFLDQLLASDTATLRELLLYHVTVEDAVDVAAIDSGLPAALTVQGESVSFTPFRYDPFTFDYINYKVDQANMIYTDWEESPGSGKIIHVIDRLIYPSTIPILPSFSQLVENLNLTLFIAAAEAVGFDPKLENGKNYTLFVPSNAAIQRSSIAQAMMASADKTQLTKMLNHHFVEGNLSMADLRAQGCQELRSLASLNIKVTSSNGEVKWNDDFTNSTVVDQLAYNGILHVIDGLLDINNIKTCSAAASGSVILSMAIGMAGTILAMSMF